MWWWATYAGDALGEAFPTHAGGIGGRSGRIGVCQEELCVGRRIEEVCLCQDEDGGASRIDMGLRSVLAVDSKRRSCRGWSVADFYLRYARTRLLQLHVLRERKRCLCRGKLNTFLRQKMDEMSWVPTSSRPWSSGRIITKNVYSDELGTRSGPLGAEIRRRSFPSSAALGRSFPRPRLRVKAALDSAGVPSI
jgi:hypothetical protein